MTRIVGAGVVSLARGKNIDVVRGVPEFHRKAADDAHDRVEAARAMAAASQLVIDEVDALLAETDVSPAG